MSARTSDGGAQRILNVVDEHTRESSGSHVARSIGATSVSRHLAKLFALYGKPKFVRADNGREFGPSTGLTSATNPIVSMRSTRAGSSASPKAVSRRAPDLGDERYGCSPGRTALVPSSFG